MAYNPIFAGSSAILTQLAVGGNAFVGSAILSLSSTTQGFLPPVMTLAQLNAIGTPVEGLEVYVTDTHQLYIYNGTSWNPVSTIVGANTSLSNLTTTAINQSLLFGSDGALNIGATAASRPNNINMLGSLFMPTMNSSKGIFSNGTLVFSAFNDSVLLGFGAKIGGAQHVVAIGSGALANNSANVTVAVGLNAGGSATTGLGNTYLGGQAGFHHTGSFSTFVGNQAGFGMANAANNTSLGYNAMAGNNTSIGDNNTAIGYATMTGIGSSGGAARNTVVGAGAGGNINNTADSTQIGYQSGGNFDNARMTMLGSSTVATSSGISNSIAIGYQASVAISNIIQLGNSSIIGLYYNGYEDRSQIVTPANPASGRDRLYFKSDDNLYSLNSAGVETQITGLNSLTSFTLLDNQPTPATVFSIPLATGTVIQGRYSINRNGIVETGMYFIATDGTNVTMDFQNVFTGSSGIAFSGVISGSNLLLQYTSTSTGNNATFKYTLTPWVA